MNTKHSLEWMWPAQIDAEKEKAPYIYVPVGAIEWHGRHNVIGLDALKAHAQLLRVAEKAGGVVYPPIYTGSLPGNNDDYTYMVSHETLYQMLTELLIGFERDGWKKVILLCGHYPNYHQVTKKIEAAWSGEDHTLQVLSLCENRLKEICGDHAALAETSMMLDLHPEAVDLDCIGGRAAAEGTVGYQNDWLDVPKDHPCRGVSGPDPRLATPEHGRKINDALVAALAGWIQAGSIGLEW